MAKQTSSGCGALGGGNRSEHFPNLPHPLDSLDTPMETNSHLTEALPHVPSSAAFASAE